MQARKLLPLVLLGLALCLAALLRARVPLAAVEIPAGETPVTNPMKGFAAWGENYRQDPYVAFAYVPVYWDELEPEQGRYDFAALEQRCHFAQWLSWITDGYQSDQNGEWLPAMPDFWQKAPSGGEFSPHQEGAWYFSQEQFPTTLQLLEQSHTTFLGPNAPQYGELTGTREQNLRTFLARMGYTLGVRRCTVWRTVLGGGLQAELVWENTGLAPLYAHWPVVLELRDDTGHTVWSGQTEVPFPSWGPGSYTLRAALTGAETLPAGDYSLWVGIQDPLTGAPGVALQMDAPRDGALYRLADQRL